MIYNSYEEALEEILTEDTTLYVSLLREWEAEKLRGYEITKAIRNLTQTEIDTLTDAQIILLKVLRYRGGETIHFYNYNIPKNERSPFEQRADKIDYKDNINRWAEISELPEKYFPYLTAYFQAQWKKAHVKPRSKKAKTFEPKLDQFSLAIFKQSITKPFKRTEAKELILKVNKAFKESKVTKEAKHIRNKFYALILDNTPEHTKVLYNSLLPTYINPEEGSAMYIPDDDEALYIEPSYITREYSFINNSTVLNRYAHDVNIVTHNNGYEDERAFDTITHLCGFCLYLYHSTGKEVFKNLTYRMIANIPADKLLYNKRKALAVQTFNKIMEEHHEQSNNNNTENEY